MNHHAYPSLPPGSVSDRLALARAALAGALALPGVRAGDGGASGRHFTATETGQRLDGVVCSAVASGGYSVSLQLICEPVALGALAEQIRESVVSEARVAGVLGVLESVDIRFSDLATSVAG